MLRQNSIASILTLAFPSRDALPQAESLYLRLLAYDNSIHRRVWTEHIGDREPLGSSRSGAAMREGSQSDSHIILGPRLEDAARPTFISRAGVRGVLVELDSSALFGLIPPSKAANADYILELERPRIASSAQRLWEAGFYPDDAEIVITLTALDL